MAALRVNIIANYLGQFWMVAMGLLFLPWYVRILGMEAFGLVGLMLTFQGVLQLFDFGIGGTANRELSRRAHDAVLADSTRDMLRSSEITIWLLAAFIALGVWICSGWMAGHWLHLKSIDSHQAGRAIAIMGLAIALLWPSTFYANCLSGLEKQPTLNLINVIFSTLRYAGVVPVLLWISPSIEAFLVWSALVGALQSLAMAFATWRNLPAGSRTSRWSYLELRNSRKFAGGLFAIGALALANSQLDRLALASLRPLEELGYYTLALSVASGLGRMVQPMFNALYPRFNRLVARNDEATLGELYHLSSQLLAVVIAAVAARLMVFARDVLWLWTGDADVAERATLPMVILVAGSALNGLVNIPYALQLAHGWTSLAAGLNAAALLIALPLSLWLVPHYGMAGAAMLWLLANLISVMVGVPLMHHRLLKGQAIRWALRDTTPPLLTGLCTALAMSVLLPSIERNLAGLTLLILASGTTLLSCVAVTPAVRALLWHRTTRFF